MKQKKTSFKNSLRDKSVVYSTVYRNVIKVTSVASVVVETQNENSFTRVGFHFGKLK